MSDVKRYAHMDGDLVTNVSLWDGETEWEPGCEIVELPDGSGVGPGWTRSGGEWIGPLPAEPPA